MHPSPTHLRTLRSQGCNKDPLRCSRSGPRAPLRVVMAAFCFGQILPKNLTFGAAGTAVVYSTAHVRWADRDPGLAGGGGCHPARSGKGQSRLGMGVGGVSLPGSHTVVHSQSQTRPRLEPASCGQRVPAPVCCPEGHCHSSRAV